MKDNVPLLRERLPVLNALRASCTLCPHACGIDRTAGERGVCRAPDKAVVYSSLLHQGEEPPVSGRNGSGVIFFSYCTLRCVYCQNFRFSQLHEGSAVTVDGLARRMIDLARAGAHNLNLVSPTPFLPFIVEALIIAREAGVSLPIVYNTSGYESVRTLRLLEGIVDIYLPDMRYADEERARVYSGAADYPAVNRTAIGEMFRQVGLLRVRKGIAERGLIVRHLVLPGGRSDTDSIFRFLAEEVSPRVSVSLMAQYLPLYRATEFPPIGRRITPGEYQQAVELLGAHGLGEGWQQEYTTDQTLAGVNFPSGEKNIPL